jgi:hypothetical protein
MGTTILLAEHFDETRSRCPIFQGNKTILEEGSSHRSAADQRGGRFVRPLVTPK